MSSGEQQSQEWWHQCCMQWWLFFLDLLQYTEAGVRGHSGQTAAQVVTMEHRPGNGSVTNLLLPTEEETALETRMRQETASWEIALVTNPQIPTSMHHSLAALSLSEPCVWLSWSNWSECSKSCDNGTKSRQRSFIPARYDGEACVGAQKETQLCNTQDCPGMCAVYAVRQAQL